MIVKSYIFTTIALILGVFMTPFFSTVPIFILIALIGTFYAIKNLIKNPENKEQITNVIPIVYNAIAIGTLFYVSIVLYQM